jgi:large subunit ribosomal protein L24
LYGDKRLLEINSNMLLKKHKRFAKIRSPLTKNLRNVYEKGNARVVKGDTVRIIRGEYKNVEGKVERVNTERSTLIIEGVQKEIAKGGKIKVHIHSSNVMITSLNLQDKRRENVIKKIKGNSLKPKGKLLRYKGKMKKSKTEGGINKVKKTFKVDNVIKKREKRTKSSDNRENVEGDIHREI